MAFDAQQRKAFTQLVKAWALDHGFTENAITDEIGDTLGAAVDATGASAVGAPTSDTSGGAGNAGKLIKLDASGKVDGIDLALPTASGGTGASGGTAPAFTGSAPQGAVDLASPVFSGTGQSSAGQVITTTDNQTMTLNQCAGMWFISATHGPYLIASNTAVTGAQAVLTIYGGAPTTDAGTYKIVRGPTPAGSVASHTHTGPAHTHALN